MKRSLIPIILLMMAATGLAAITQSGYVKTRGRLGSNGQVIPGKRIESATVELQNGSSVVSNKSGNFNLSLPANKFYLKNVKKSGYVVSDPDMLSKQYAYSPNPLILVLDEPTSQQDDKLASERKLRRNLQKQLQQREDELEALKEENRITQDQYREALQKLYADQESNEKFISEMAERYSKMDFDQLDEFQTRIATFIQNGELVRADSLLHTKGSMDDREAELNRFNSVIDARETEIQKEIEDLNKAKAERDLKLADFGADCYNHFEICKLRFENDSAAYWLERRAMADTTNINWLLDAGNFIIAYIADYPKALDFYTRALNNSLIQFGEKHMDVATIYNNIGIVYINRGDYAKALENHEKALNIRLGVFGENHSHVATSYNNIGNVYYYQGVYSKALENYEKALNIQLRVFGENHPEVATSYNNIALVYANRGDYSNALENYERALKIQLGILGEKHPNVAMSYNNIGYTYYSLGDYAKALENHERALSIRLDIFGENHPDVALSYYNIGLVYANRGDYSKALENLERALNIRLGFFGENHPVVGVSYYYIGNVYYSQGEYAKALENIEKARTILLNFVDENHPYILQIANNINNIKEILRAPKGITEE